MKWFLIGGAVLLFLWLVVPYFFGNPSFWRLTRQHGDAAYDWFVAEDCWVVEPEDGSPPKFSRPRENYVGPFRVAVPKLGGRLVKVWGEDDKIEESEKQFADHIAGLR